MNTFKSVSVTQFCLWAITTFILCTTANAGDVKKIEKYFELKDGEDLSIHNLGKHFQNIQANEQDTTQERKKANECLEAPTAKHGTWIVRYSSYETKKHDQDLSPNFQRFLREENIEHFYALSARYQSKKNNKKSIKHYLFFQRKDNTWGSAKEEVEENNKEKRWVVNQELTAPVLKVFLAKFLHANGLEVQTVNPGYYYCNTDIPEYKQEKKVAVEEGSWCYTRPE